MRTEADGTITYFPLDQPGSEVAVAWYVELPYNHGNVLAMVFRDGPDQPWKAVARTRMYVDDRTDDTSKDRRQGYMITDPLAENQDIARASLIQKIDAVVEHLVSVGAKLETRLSEHKSLNEFLDLWQQQPWANVRVQYIH